MGHIVSHEGMKIDLKRVEAISRITLPGYKKEVQDFLGRINFLRIFIPNYVEIVKGITDMLRKDNEVKWSPIPCDSFNRIKEALAKAPMLASPDHSAHF